MDVHGCGISWQLPTWQEMAEQTTQACHRLLSRIRLLEFVEYASCQLHRTIAKVQQVAEALKEPIIFAVASTIAALLNPAPFFGAMAVGLGLGLMLDGMYGAPGGRRTVASGRGHELCIAQTTLAAVTLGCQAVQSVSLPWVPVFYREGTVSAAGAGLLAGAVCAAVVRRFYGQSCAVGSED